MPLLTYLAWLQLITNNSRLIFQHVRTKDALLVVKIFIKQNSCSINQQSLISRHFNQLLKVIIKIAPSENACQNCSFKNHTSIILAQNYTLKKGISKLLSQRYFLFKVSINAAKGKTNINKSRIMYGPIVVIHYFAFVIIKTHS